jgi:ABC-2 type transport system ATP-binding protein
MQDIEALTERILLIGKGRILLDGSLEELKKRSSQKKTIIFEYTGAAPTLGEGITAVEERPGRLVMDLEPGVASVSGTIAHIAAQVEVIDISVSGISAEEMVAGLYREYHI